MARTIEETDEDIEEVVSYDVACQYKANLPTRFEKREPHLLHRIPRRILIGKMHVQAHNEICQYLYSWNYTEGVGRSDGEEVERWWAEANQAAGSTKQMNAGHRREVLSDLMNDWNWTKNENARTFLDIRFLVDGIDLYTDRLSKKRLLVMREELAISESNFADFTEGIKQKGSRGGFRLGKSVNGTDTHRERRGERV